MKSTKLLALAAVLTALGAVLMFAGSAVQVLDLTSAALVSIIVIYSVIEMGGFWPYAIYAATSLLSLLILPYKLPAVIYALFAGYYPIFKSLVERKLPAIPGWIAKFALFNAALTGVIAISRYVLHLPEEEIAFTWVIYALGNVTFLVYDLALSRLISFYYARLKKRFGIKK